jgi:hypothetical protein
MGRKAAHRNRGDLSGDEDGVHVCENGPKSLQVDSSILFEVTPPTGEPDAGDPHIQLGGRGEPGNQPAPPAPIKDR